jgi:hypothetical protein
MEALRLEASPTRGGLQLSPHENPSGVILGNVRLDANRDTARTRDLPADTAHGIDRMTYIRRAMACLHRRNRSRQPRCSLPRTRARCCRSLGNSTAGILLPLYRNNAVSRRLQWRCRVRPPLLSGPIPPAR